MESWALVVPRDRAEGVRRRLLDRDLLQKNLRIGSEGDAILLPIRRRVEMGFPTAQKDFAEGFTAIRSYRDVVELPASARGSLPRSFDVIGDLAVIKIPETLREHRRAIGTAILRWNPNLKAVLEDRGVKGDHRIRQTDVIAGASRTTTIHREHGLGYRVDLSQAYFSPRLASERKRIADLVREGERVADPFAGVGPYSVLIATGRGPAVVYASDANPTAVRLLRANVAVNRAERVTVLEGDARAILARVAPVDRVILDLPHSAIDYLPHALGALGDEGTVHLYMILEPSEESGRDDQVTSASKVAGFRIRSLSHHRVRAYSPTKYHTAFDVTVARG